MVEGNNDYLGLSLDIVNIFIDVGFGNKHSVRTSNLVVPGFNSIKSLN